MTADTAVKAPARTSYTLLKRIEPLEPALGVNSVAIGKGAFVLVAESVPATSGQAAIKQHAAKAGAEAAGTYIAVPSRSFMETTVKVETTTTVKLT